MAIDRVLILIQTRLQAHRLPDKVLQPIMGQSMILHQLDRLRDLDFPYTLVVAIPDTPRDIEVLKPFIEKHGYLCMAGAGLDENDVLGRFALITRALSPTPPDEEFPMMNYFDCVVRLCGDCPLIDPDLIEIAMMYYEHQHADLVALANDWPDGLDLEVIRTEALLLADDECKDMQQREHVSQHIWSNKSIKEYLIACPFDLSKHNWSVDDAGNLDFARRVYDSLYSSTPDFRWRDVYALLMNDPHLMTLATNRNRNQAFMDQLALKHEGHGMTWEEVRYGNREGNDV